MKSASKIMNQQKHLGISWKYVFKAMLIKHFFNCTASFRVAITALFLFQTMFGMAKQITKSESLKIAQQFYQKQCVSKGVNLKSATALDFKLNFICTDSDEKLKSASVSTTSLNDSTGYYFIYNVGENQGFVIVSGDDRTTPVLGYSDEGKFYFANMPEHVQKFMEHYKQQIKVITSQNNALSLKSSMIVATNDSAVAPLITTKWGQLAPYNSKIPISAPTGCLSTAMAQIMNYHKWPLQGTSSHSYTYNGNTFSVNFASTTYDWANMKNEYTAIEDIASASCKAVGTLMYNCGVSLDMQYDAKGSNAITSSIPTAFINYFGYDKNLQMIWSSDYTSIQWKYKVKSEINAKRPVMIFGTDGNAVGHEYIADGYDRYNFIHINWGWDGMYNGYYETDPLDASIYYVPGSLMIGIQKPTLSTNPSLCYNGFGLANNSTKKRNTSTSTTINIFEENGKSFNGEIGLAFFKNEILYKIISTTLAAINTSTTLAKSFIISIPDTLSGGTYRLVPIFKTASDTNWSEIKYKNSILTTDTRINENVEFVVNGTDFTIFLNSKTMNCKKGYFKTYFSSDDWANIQRLVVSGDIDQWDMLYMAAGKSIKSIDIKDANIIHTKINTPEIAYGGKPTNFDQFVASLSSNWKNFEEHFWHGHKYSPGNVDWVETAKNVFYNIKTGLYGLFTGKSTATFDNSVGYRVDFGHIGADGLIMSIDRDILTIGGKGIMADAFANSTVESISLPSNLRYIGPMAFAKCPNLKTINLPDSISLVGDSLFYNCPNLTEIKFPKNIKNIWTQSFSKSTKMSTVTLPDSLSIIQNYCFKDMASLTSITIPSTVTSIGEFAFANCNGLTSLSVPSSVSWIGSSTFSGCTKLTAIMLSAGLTSIGSSAFQDCTGLNSISVPSSVESIGNNVFKGCTHLSSINVYRNIPVALSTNQLDYCFTDVNKTTCVLHVPTGSKAAYQAAVQWKDFTKIVDDLPASVNKTVNVTIAGTLSTLLTSAEKTTVTNLTITGTIDARDFKTLRDYMPALSVIDIGSVTVSTYTGAEGTFSAGNTYYPGNAIPKRAFINPKAISDANNAGSIPRGKIGLTSVKIPQSVTTIGNESFAYSNDLISIDISSLVTSIGENAFLGCSGLINVEANNMKYSGLDGVLFDKTKIQLIQCPTSKTENYIIPASVTSIQSSAFFNCSHLSLIDIPSQVTSIGDSTFFRCSSLTSVLIPASIISIGSRGFSGCSSLTGKLTIPNSVISIGRYAFSDCSKLTEIVLPTSIKTIEYGTFKGCTGLKTFSIPSSVTSIGESAFYNCSGLTSITIPSLVTSIGSAAFYGCSGLTSLTTNSTIPVNLSSVFNVFTDINKTTCVLHVPAGTKAAYQGAVQWKDFTIRDGLSVYKIVNVTTAGTLSSLLTPAEKTTVTELTLTGIIDARDFKTMRDNMPALSTINLSAVTVAAYIGTGGTKGNYNASYAVNEVPEYAFFIFPTDNIRLTSVVLPTSITSIAYYAFGSCIKLTDVKIPSSVTNIGSDAFAKCSSLTSITIPSSITTIRGFRGCIGLTSVSIPSSVTIIGAAAFEDCIGLTSVSIPSSVTIIGESAFTGCTALASVIIPASVSKILNYAFSACGSISVDEQNPNYSSFNGVLFNKDQSLLIHCTNLKTETYNIPSTVKTIDIGAFYGCEKLFQIIIPSSVSSIGSVAFVDCSSLTSVVIPSSVTSIGNWTFADCSGLTSVVIPSSITTIEMQAFNGCSGLNSIYSYSKTPIKLGSDVFYKVNKTTCVLFVPKGSKGAYQVADQWKDFTNIVEVDIPTGIANIDRTAETIIYVSEQNVCIRFSENPRNTTVSVYDLTGRLITSKMAEDLLTTILVARSGIYLVRIAENDKYTVKKVLVNKSN